MKIDEYKQNLEKIYSLSNLNLKKLLIFYLQTSTYTYLGPYSDFARELTDDIEELCILQRMQTIHPMVFTIDKNIRNHSDSVFGDMTKIPIDRLNNEEDIYQTALSIFSELLRRDNTYSVHREAKNKIHIVCRGNALLLASILKAKGIPSRVRVGFSKYHFKNKYDDQWNTEYFDMNQNKWIMVDSSGIGGDTIVPIDMINVPKDMFLTAAEAWLSIRNHTISDEIVIYDTGGYSGLKAACLELMNDFNSLMNNEKSFLFEPNFIHEYKNNQYVVKDFSEEELKELDDLAELMQDCDKNFEKLYSFYKNNSKFKVMLGISVWN